MLSFAQKLLHTIRCLKVVGPPNTGKTTLCKLLLALPDTTLRLHVREAETLPLPENADRPAVDMIVFMVDMTDGYS